MSTFNLLLVEDNDAEIKTFQDTLERYNAQKQREIVPTIAKNLRDSLIELKNSFDGAIVDIKLGQDEDAGNGVLKEILANFRIPVVVYTAIPANVPEEYNDFVKVIPRATELYDVPLDFLYAIYDTGLTRIMGGRGEIEIAMDKVFWKNILPQLNTWITYRSKGKNTEKALLRYIMNHIVEHVDQDAEKYFPEEMYISPVISASIKTGCIVKKPNEATYYIVLSPACDLALHNGNFKTERIMVCQIDLLEGYSKDQMTNLQLNKLVLYKHYLPKINQFPGGCINFRKIETFEPIEFNQKFEKPIAQISNAFLKNIISRLSTFYSRQGQPDFDLAE
jgi:CheY-like chemotaxis protein